MGLGLGWGLGLGLGLYGQGACRAIGWVATWFDLVRGRGRGVRVGVE